MNGDQSYLGDTAVNNGSLVFNGAIDSPQVTINTSGILGGSGTFAGNLINRGTVSPGNSPGTLTIAGDYTQRASGTLITEIASSTSFDKLAIGGKANLDGTLQIVTLGGFTLAEDDQLSILTADDGVDGEFATIDQSRSTAEFDVTYLSDEVQLSLAGTQLVSFFDKIEDLDLTPNQRATANVIDRSSTDPLQSDLVEFLLARDPSALLNELDRISPEELAVLFEIILAGSNSQNFTIGNRLNQARAGVSGFRGSLNFTDSRGTINSHTPRFRQLVGSAGEPIVVQDAPSTAQGPWNMWATGQGDFVDVDSDFNARGYDFRSGGVTVGVDRKVSQHLIVGLAASYHRSDGNLANGGDTDADGSRVALYGSYFDGGAYVNAIAGAGYNTFDTSRNTIAGTFARGDTEGLSFDAMLGGGYDFKAGNVTYGPTASLAYTNVGIDGFQRKRIYRCLKHRRFE